jgi:hypothetical protein
MRNSVSVSTDAMQCWTVYVNNYGIAEVEALNKLNAYRTAYMKTTDVCKSWSTPTSTSEQQ